jgi:isochorismate pyruvate lyase
MTPESCTSMAEVRAGIDALDREILALIATRMRFMDAAARIKSHRDDVRDEERKAQVIVNARRLAVELGVPPDLAEAVWEALVEGSIAYEFEQFDRR